MSNELDRVWDELELIGDEADLIAQVHEDSSLGRYASRVQGLVDSVVINLSNHFAKLED